MHHSSRFASRRSSLASPRSAASRFFGSRTRRTRRPTPRVLRASAARSRPKAGACRIAGSSASARTAWHRHPGGQLLFVEKGRARVQERGGTLHELATGESHYTAPNVEHWHGATPDSEFTQVALGRGDAAETVWLEKVSDEQYAGR